MDLAKFWAHVDKQGPTIRGELGPCWIWNGVRDRSGYGRYGMTHTKQVFAHRLSYFIEHGCWPTGEAMHKCDTPSCVRPAHLVAGTHADNMRDASVKGRMHPGELTGGAQLTAADVRTIRVLLQTHSIYRVSKMYGRGWSTINKVAKGITWRHVP